MQQLRRAGAQPRPATPRSATVHAAPVASRARLVCAVSRLSALQAGGLRLAATRRRQQGVVRAQATTITATPAASGTLSLAAIAPATVAVLGAQGTLALKLAKGLLEAGNKVTAAVDFPDQAKVTLDFVRKYELISRAQLANLKLAEKDSDLPKKARVVIVEGDMLGDRKTEVQYVEQALAKAAAADAAQVVLVTSGSARGGSFFNFGPSPSQPNKALSRSEQLVAGSGLPFAIVRMATSDDAPADAAVKVSAGPGALAFATAPVSEATAALVLGAVLGSPAPPANVAVLLEVAALPPGTAQGPAVPALVAQAIEATKGKEPLVPLATPPAKEEAPAPTAKDAASPLSAMLGTAPLVLGTISLRRSLSPEPAEEAKPAPKAAGPKPAAKAPASLSKKPAARDEEEEEAPARPFGNLFAGLFGGVPAGSGTLKVSDAKQAPPIAARKVAPPPPAKPAPAPRSGTTSIRMTAPPAASLRTTSPAPSKPNPFSSIVSRRGTTTVSASPPPVPEKSAAAAAPKPNPFSTVKRAPAAAARDAAPKEEVAPASKSGIFGWFAINPTGPSSSLEAPVAKAAPAKPAAKAPLVPARPVAPVPARRATAAEPAAEPKKSSGGFLAFLGLGSKPAGSDEEEEVEVAPRARSAPVPVARKAPPPAPARQASAPVPAKQVGNPFSTVKRTAPPPAPAKPAPAKPAQATQRTGTQPSRQAAPTPARPMGTGTNIRGTYKPVSGFSVQPKK